MAQTWFRTCSLCEAMCGLKIEVEGERVVSIRGDDDDELSRGYMCPKGPALADLHSDPARLRRPQRRTRDGGWAKIGWDEALDEAATRLHEIQQRHGRDAVAVYIGNPAVHNTGALLYGPNFLRSLGTRHRYSATSVDQLPQMLAAYLMFGHQLLLPIPDIDRTKHMVVLGGNPMVSNGSIMSAPGIKRRFAELRARGGKLVVIDPRRTETARLADEHVFVRPGSDAALLGAMVHVLLADGRRPASRLGRVENLERLREVVAPLSPSAAARVTGIDATTIERLARELADAESGVLYGRVGVSMHPFGGSCHWLVNVVNILTGALDEPGGSMFTRPAYDLVGGPRALGVGQGSFGRWHSKVRRLPEFGGELPVATLAEDIEAEGEPAIRALVTIAGNPVLSAPNGPRLDAALAKLDYRVAVDFYLGETARHADLVLPPTGPLERGHYDVVFHALAVRNSAKYSPPIFEPGPEQRHDYQILVGLERRLLHKRGAPAAVRATTLLRERLGPERILELGFRAGPWGFGGGVGQGLRGVTMAKLRAAPHGIDLGPLTPVLPDRLATHREGGRFIDLAPEALADDLRTRTEALLHEPAANTMVLIGRRQLRGNNSWMHNVPKLMAGKPRCTALVHPDDAARLKIADGDEVRLSTRVGEVVVPAELDEDIMPGVVSLPHGFGHDRDGTGIPVATEHAGVSLNDLTDDQRIDPSSGVAAFSGVPVDLTPA